MRRHGSAGQQRQQQHGTVASVHTQQHARTTPHRPAPVPLVARRVLCISATHISTLYPDTLAPTNSWSFAGPDPDLAGVELAGETAEGATLVLHFRRDKKVRVRVGNVAWVVRSNPARPRQQQQQQQQHQACRCQPSHPPPAACVLPCVMPACLRACVQGLNSKDARFACRDRAAVLCALYGSIGSAAARSICSLAPSILG